MQSIALMLIASVKCTTNDCLLSKTKPGKSGNGTNSITTGLTHFFVRTS